MSAEYWENIKKLDMYTLQHIFKVILDIDVKQFNMHENRTQFSEGENYGYRTLLGELSRLIEHKKTSDKTMKERARRVEHMKSIIKSDDERERESLK